METNKIPEKVYIIPGNPYWASQKEFDREIEYIRTDVFIKKACEWWENEFIYPSMTPEEIEWYKDEINKFRKAMEGE